MATSSDPSQARGLMATKVRTEDKQYNDLTIIFHLDRIWSTDMSQSLEVKTMVSTLASRTRRRYFRVLQRQRSATGCIKLNNPHAQITTTTTRMYTELLSCCYQKIALSKSSSDFA
jgi:hypothetical protein